MNPRIEGPVSLLRLELPVDLGELQAHGLRSPLAAGGALHHASDDDVAHLDDEELLLPFARLPKCDGGFLQVRTRRASLQQLRRRLVDFVNDGKILECRLAGTPAAAGRNVWVFVTPQEYDSTSTSSLCLSSRDSPLISPIFAKMSAAMATPEQSVVRLAAGRITNAAEESRDRDLMGVNG